MELDKFECPVCHEHAFDRIGDYEICPVCGWENDKIQTLEPDFEGGANGMSLNQARLAYAYKKERGEDCD